MMALARFYFCHTFHTGHRTCRRYFVCQIIALFVLFMVVLISGLFLGLDLDVPEMINDPIEEIPISPRSK